MLYSGVVIKRARKQRRGVGKTSHRSASWLAWSMWALSLGLSALSVLLLALHLSHHPDVPIFPFWAEDVLIAIGFSTVGAIIVPRISPKNPIGWLFCVMGLSFGVLSFSGEYAIYALLVTSGSLPAGEVAAWILSWSWVVCLGLVVFTCLLFPEGRLPSRRWRWFAWLSLFLILELAPIGHGRREGRPSQR